MNFQNQPGPTTNKNKLRILLVEDNEDVRTVIRLGLDLLGYEVLECVDGNDAIAQFSEFRPHVAIVDHGLPDVPGIEVGRQIRAQSGNPQYPMTLLTGTDGLKVRQAAEEAGFTGFLVKPLRIQALANWIDAQLGKT